MKQLSDLLFKISAVSRKIANRLSANPEWRKTLLMWKNDNGNMIRRLDYSEPNSNSVVFDLGGYEGQWASDIFSKYQCQIIIFEPCLRFAAQIGKRFENNNNIMVCPFGLSDKDAHFN